MIPTKKNKRLSLAFYQTRPPTMPHRAAGFDVRSKLTESISTFDIHRTNHELTIPFSHRLKVRIDVLENRRDEVLFMSAIEIVPFHGLQQKHNDECDVHVSLIVGQLS
jgi:hypothetical protein